MAILWWKRLTKVIGLMVVCSLVVFMGAPTHAKMVEIDGKTYDLAVPGEFAPGEVIVQARPEAVGGPAQSLEAVGAGIAAQVGGQVKATIPQLNLYRIKLSALPGTMAADAQVQKAQVAAAVQTLRQNPAVLRADFNYKKSIFPPIKKAGARAANKTAAGSSAAVTEATPVNPTAEASPLAPTPTTLGKEQWHLDRIKFWQAGAPPASAPIIAVVDTGVDYTHPDLSTPLGKVILGHDFFNDDDDPMDDNSHGTHVAGIAAASGTSALGLMGVSPTSRILAVKVFPYSGGADSFTCWQGWLYARDYPGVKVINFSGGGYAPEDSAFFDMEKDVVDSIVARKVVFVCAAGNDADLPLFQTQGFENYRVTPAWFPNSLTVAASETLDYRAYFSNYNLGTYNGMTFNYNFADIVAPGWSILSSTPVSHFGSWNPYYDWYSGTSMASPVVTGAAARVLAKNPTFTPAQVLSKLKNTGKTLATSSGWYLSPKRLDLMKALDVTGVNGFMGVVYGGQYGRYLSGVKVQVLDHGTTTPVIKTVFTSTDGFFTVTGLTAGAKYDFKFSKGTKYSTFIFDNYGAGLATTSNNIADLPYSVVLNQVVPDGDQWSLLIVWNSWQPGYNDALTTYWGKPDWYPFNWPASAGTYFTTRLKLPNLTVLHLQNRGSRQMFPYAVMTHDPWFINYDTGLNSSTPSSNFVIAEVMTGYGVPYKLYCNLNDGFDPGTYYQWGTYEKSKAVAYLYKGGVLQNGGQGVEVTSAFKTGPGPLYNWWYIADIDGNTNTATIKNLRQDTEP